MGDYNDNQLKSLNDDLYDEDLSIEELVERLEIDA